MLFSTLPSMDFKKSLDVNGNTEELIFIGWDDYNITNFIVLGLDYPVFMRYNRVSNSWHFIEKVDPSLAPYEAELSDIINDHLRLKKAI
jgi:hypothetical protein